MKNIWTEINKELSKFPEYWSDGNLIKPKVTEDIKKYREDLIEQLFSNEEIKKAYTKKIGDTIIFKVEDFLDVLRYKNFLENSYTRYSNEIGLTSDGRYLTYNSDVVLDFPYKDCLLEGGMTREDSAKKEVFYHQVLAKGEIDILLAPKVLSKPKRYTEKGEETATFFSSDDNLILKGNNLIALHSLKARYEKQVKLIYIDPPYNTEQDSFKYNDRFNHSTWLTFMKNRLDAAWHLLQEKGLIFVHIGDQELHYLKVLMDSIFGRENFIATVPRKTRSGKSDVPYKLSQDYDWMLIYTKAASTNDKLFQREVERKYFKTPDFPDDEWRLSDLTKQTSIKERPKSNFSIINPKNGDEYPVNPNRSWSITVDTVDSYISRGKIVFPGDYDFLNIKQPAMRIFKSEEIKKHGEDFNKAYVSTEFVNKTMDVLLKDAVNKKGTDEIVGLFGEKIFSFPKNEVLLGQIIEYCTEENDIVLDFFAGSGTTAAVAHKMNRRYIAVEQMDYIESVTVERIKKVIAGEQGGISKAVDWKGGGDFIYAELCELNSMYLPLIERAESDSDIEAIIKDMKSMAFLDHKINLDRITIEDSSYNNLNLSEKKKVLIESLDFNQMYLSFSEIEDDYFSIPLDTKEFNYSFYSKRTTGESYE